MKETVVVEKVDGQTGELISEESKKTYSIAKEPNFVKLYMSDLASIYQLPKSSILVLLSLLPHTSYADEGQIVTINSYTKKQILFANKEIGSTQTINNAVSHLKRVGILSLIDRATYKLNPNIIGKGEWRDILNLRMTIDYSVDGRKIKTEITTKDGKKSMEVPDINKTGETTESVTDTDTEKTTNESIVGGVVKEVTTTPATESTETATTATATRRPGRAGTSKPDTWSEDKPKLLSGEIKKAEYCRQNHISPNTLKKWLAE